MLTVIPQPANDWLKNANPLTALGSFPPNLAANLLPPELQRKIYDFMFRHYIWPQVMERQTFEPMWQKLLDMYRIKLQKVDVNISEGTALGNELKEDDVAAHPENVRLADSVVYDAIERLTCVQHFISFKSGCPIQYNIPDYFDNRSETAFYHPRKDKIQAGNALLQWNIDNQQIYRKHFIASRHHYTYGCSFAISQFLFSVQQVQRMTNTGKQMVIPEIEDIGVSFDPVSIWKLWLNWRLSASEMDYQPCPFYYEETPRFATLQNVYDPRSNPFGYANLDKVASSTSPQWLYTGSEATNYRQTLEKLFALDNAPTQTMPQILDAKYSVEAKWTFFPMLPLDPQTLEFETRKDGSPIPFSRYLVESWGTNLFTNQVLLRVQRNFYPRDMLPLYGSAQMPDLDSGLYPPSLGYLLWNHYKEIVTMKNQYLVNKDKIIDPPMWVLTSSPAASRNDLTKKGAKIEVTGKEDFGPVLIPDVTQSTVAMMQQIRDQAKTSSKTDDALLGQALGSRTSATEAQNVFQLSMSVVTTPIDIFNYDIMGGYATRVWEYTATWFPPELLRSITGQMGFVISPEDLWMRVGLKWDVATTYIESIVRQRNIQYILQSSMGDPSINRPAMWRALLDEWRFDNSAEWVNDGGFQREVWEATDQVYRTMMTDEPVMIDPDQNHQVAIEVKKSFLEDKDSAVMQKYPERAPLLLRQILLHQKFLEMQLRMQAAQMEANKPVGGAAIHEPPQPHEITGPTGGGAAPAAQAAMAATGGEAMQGQGNNGQ